MSEKTYDAMTMTEENPLYVKFLRDKEEFVSKHKKITSLNNYTDDINALIYLCYVTRTYFRDNILISFAKLGFGVGAILIAIFLEVFAKASIFKAPMMIALFLYALIMIPLSLLYIVANYVCYVKFLDYVSTSTSTMAKKIIVFYDEETDKFQAVNWKSIFKNDSSAYNEAKRKRGW